MFIDMANLNHFTSAIDSDGVVLIKPFKLFNNNDGFYMLLAKLCFSRMTASSLSLNQLLNYGNNWFPFLVPKGFNICVINLIHAANLRKNSTRKTKADEVNALIIAQAITMMDDPQFVTFRKIALIQPKHLEDFG